MGGALPSADGDTAVTGASVGHAATIGSGSDLVSAAGAGFHTVLPATDIAATGTATTSEQAAASVAGFDATHMFTQTNPATAAHAGALPLPTSSGWSIDDLLAGIGANVAHPGTLPLVLAAAAGAAGMGMTFARCFGPALQLSGGPVPLLFSTVRLIPCTAVQTVEGSIATVGEAADRVESLVGRVGSAVKDELKDVKDGFNSARERAERTTKSIRHEFDGGEGAGDNRLLMQLAMLLGSGYVAFLTLWFWVTRARLNGRH
jgi:hypothetical protein